ncbi:MAG: protease modulator HflC [Planctomycetes bacterium]|nr:protease modulator HflC [Planctomycetota bacterium]
MKNVWVFVFVLLIVSVLGLYLFTFQVSETEIAVVTRFGEPTRTLYKPGVYLKWPRPINHIQRYDGRNQIYETVLTDTTTAGGEPITVTSYIIWKIDDPLVFRESVVDKEEAEIQLDVLLQDTQNTVIGQHYFGDFVNSDLEKIKFTEIENEMATRIGPAAKKLGIDVKVIGIRRLAVSETVTKAVFERMKAERTRKTEAITKAGETEADTIKKNAEARRTELLAIVEARAKAIRGSGDAEAAGYYKMLEDDPEFAMFLRDIEALRKILEKETTIVLGADTDPIQLLKKVPDIKPKERAAGESGR